MNTQRTLKESIKKLPPIVIIPDKSYVDDTDHLIVTDAIVIVAPESYKNLLSKMTNQEDFPIVRMKDGES